MMKYDPHERNPLSEHLTLLHPKLNKNEEKHPWPLSFMLESSSLPG
jgi:hypothetical protein